MYHAIPAQADCRRSFFCAGFQEVHPVIEPADNIRPALTIFANADKIAEIQPECHDMPTRNVNLTDALDQFVASTVEAGRYENASEVVRAGLRALQEREQAYISFMRNEAAAGFAELDRGEGIRGTPDEIMDLINEELGITDR
jgi:antitoxin ParD1/3/4